jgi:histone acetyltransferase
MDRLMKDLKSHPQAWAFLKPVDSNDVPDYYEVIKKPMGMVLYSSRIILIFT